MISLPIPGQANTLSVTTANAMVEPSSSPTTVTTGIMMFFSTCTKITRAGVNPLARANFTKSIGSVSRTPARVRRSTNEMLNSDKFERRQQQMAQPVQRQERPLHAEQLRRRRRARCWAASRAATANTMISISPTQNVGSEKPRMLPAMIVRPTAPSGYSPAYSPSGMPKDTDISTAVTASSIVAGMRCAISRSAGSLNTKLRPRLPCSASLTNSRYCFHSG